MAKFWWGRVRLRCKGMERTPRAQNDVLAEALNAFTHYPVHLDADQYRSTWKLRTIMRSRVILRPGLFPGDAVNRGSEAAGQKC